MSLIPIKIDRTSKPPPGTPLRTDGHWSTQGLAGAWVFNEGLGSSTFDGVRQDPATVKGSSGLAGGALRGDGSSVCAKTEKSIGFPGDYSFVFHVNYKSYILNQLIAELGPITDSTQGFLINGGTATNVYIQLAIRNGGSFSQIIIPILPLNTPSQIAFVVRSSIVANAGGITAYRNGAPVTGTYPTPHKAPGALAAQQLNFLSRNSTSLFANIDLNYFFAYSRAVLDSEISSLYNNPWQIYEPETIWFEVGEAAVFEGAFSGEVSILQSLSGQIGCGGGMTSEVGSAVYGLGGGIGGSAVFNAQLNSIVQSLGGQLGVVGTTASLVSTSADILGKLGISASLASELANIGARIVEIVIGDKIYRVVITTKTGSASVSTAAGRINVITQ